MSEGKPSLGRFVLDRLYQRGGQLYRCIGLQTNPTALLEPLNPTYEQIHKCGCGGQEHVAVDCRNAGDFEALIPESDLPNPPEQESSET